jgi:5-methyltetrahydrofolate--homocysteine methyltransferase
VLSAGKFLIATVRGDVHDIGKNIVGVVASTAGWEVTDLGVMVEAERIADEAERLKPEIIGLSGLITPSLGEMIRVVKELGRRGLTTPVIIGGATTSRLHTAVKIAPEYEGLVVHSRDASENVRVMAALSGPNASAFIAETRAAQEAERQLHNATSAARTALPLAEARQRAYRKHADAVAVPQHMGRVVFADYPIAEVIPYINWAMFHAAWQVRGAEERDKVRADAERLLERIKTEHVLRLEGVCSVFSARRGRDGAAGVDGKGAESTDDIFVTAPRGAEVRLPQLRSQAVGAAVNLSAADYVSADAQDYVGLFALTAGVGLAEFTEKLRAGGDDYNAIMAKLLADRLTEAFAESVHDFVRRVAWGYDSGQTPTPPDEAIRGRYRGVRFAFGYPATPDHSLKEEVFELLGVRETTAMRLTDNYMIEPGEALCGIMVADREAKFFTLGPLSPDQTDDYARRRGKSTEEIKRLITNE